MKIIIILLIVNNICLAQTYEFIDGGSYVSQRTVEEDRGLLSIQILSNRSTVPGREVNEIVTSSLKASKTFKIPASILLAIAFVESSYKLNAVNKASNDYGIMQVNEWHVKRSKLSKRRLLTDLDYSFYHGARIFNWFYRKYPLDEAIRRYNCGTKPSCIKYRRVKKYLTKVKKAM